MVLRSRPAQLELDLAEFEPHERAQISALAAARGVSVAVVLSELLRGQIQQVVDVLANDDEFLPLPRHKRH